MSSVTKTIIEFFKKYRRETVLVAATALIIIMVLVLISALITHNSPILLINVGKVHTLNVEVYGGNLTTINGELVLDWGTVYPGIKVNRTFYIKSKSNVEGTLIIKTGNWTFKNTETYTYDKTEWMNIIEPPWNETKLKPNQEIFATITLNVTNSQEFIDWLIENEIKSFSFDITITLKP